MTFKKRRKAGRLDQALTLMRTLQSAGKQRFGLEMQLVSSAGTNSGCQARENTSPQRGLNERNFGPQYHQQVIAYFLVKLRINITVFQKLHKFPESRCNTHNINA